MQVFVKKRDWIEQKISFIFWRVNGFFFFWHIRSPRMFREKHGGRREQRAFLLAVRNKRKFDKDSKKKKIIPRVLYLQESVRFEHVKKQKKISEKHFFQHAYKRQLLHQFRDIFPSCSFLLRRDTNLKNISNNISYIVYIYC